MFSGKLNLKNNLWFKYLHYKFIRSMNLWNTSTIYGQLSKVQTRTHVSVIPAFILGPSSKPLQPVCRELNSDHFAFFKTYSSCSRTHSSSVSNRDTLFMLARLINPDPEESYKIWGRIMIWILKRGQFYTVSEKRLANLHFFVKKWLNMTIIFGKLLLKIKYSLHFG
jgi:hypothetical protein